MTKIIMPSSMYDVVQAIGFEASVKLMDSLGGISSFYIPKTAKPNHQLSCIIGIEAFSALCSAFGGESIFIPRGAFRRLKKSMILEADATISNRKLCRILGCSQRYVIKIKNQLKDDRQGELF